MKRLLFVLCCATLFSVIGPVPRASASWWPWHHHSKNSGSSTAPAHTSKSKQPKAPKAKKEKHRHEKAAKVDNGGVVTTPGPRSVGWWRKQPGPAGAGAN